MKHKMQILKLNNCGSSIVEATVTLPLFLFFVIAIFSMGRCKMAELQMYEACAETAEYIAEYAYLSDAGTLLAPITFEKYVDNKALIDKYVKGGTKKGVFFLCDSSNKAGDTVLNATYKIKLSVPMLPELKKTKLVSIKQFAYLGSKDRWENFEDEYVFITDAGKVYHRRRSCSHLIRRPIALDISTAKAKGYTICELCGDNRDGKVFVTEDGSRYHFSSTCSSLKRTVYRMKKSEVEDLSECYRCKREGKNYNEIE